MAIFNSYVSLPEGSDLSHLEVPSWDSSDWSLVLPTDTAESSEVPQMP